VARTDLPFFDGTGWKVGDVAADVVGYEWDNRDPDGDGKRLWDAARSLDPAIDPASISVLFRGEAIADDGSHGAAEATYLLISRVRRCSTRVRCAGLGLGRRVSRPAFQRFNGD
jgi:hypothetical protein